MNDRNVDGRPGPHHEHQRQLARLRRSSGWLGLLILIAVLVFYQLHRSEPALFQAADVRHEHPVGGQHPSHAGRYVVDHP